MMTPILMENWYIMRIGVISIPMVLLKYIEIISHELMSLSCQWHSMSSMIVRTDLFVEMSIFYLLQDDCISGFV